MKYAFNMILAVCLLAISISANAQTAPADTANLKAYAGSYTFASGSPIQKFTVTSEKGELYGEADTYGKNKLVKQAKADTYQSTSSYGSIITFVRDAATKAVTSLTMAVQGTELTAKKDNP
ncbi:DUF3471 domain-containing protein [Spirosoma linguale]|uniref:Peptidase S12 Pab87-related C-terminal domain-containing protein n=1 Tax=Spirosoma linguale (strain ATCC 33905 / DSM 74 / LMG 10896 / Claus 1) TaxID=504472 RepID=D2QJ51_SPILD|nr:hypothetical protein Slin_1014 [Spirosoma linguale DSM 74]